MPKQRILNKELEPNFTGIFIPKEVWLCEELTPIQMLLMMQIKSLDNKFGCKATNNRFAEFFGVSDGTISEHIQNLVEKDFLVCQYDESNRRTMKVSLKFKLIIADIDEDLDEYKKTIGKPKTSTEKPETSSENPQTSSENIEHRITLEEHSKKHLESGPLPPKKLIENLKEEIKGNPFYGQTIIGIKEKGYTEESMWIELQPLMVIYISEKVKTNSFTKFNYWIKDLKQKYKPQYPQNNKAESYERAYPPPFRDRTKESIAEQRKEEEALRLAESNKNSIVNALSAKLKVKY
jgi:DNA-binding MarR family transcriptional regulator